MLRSLSLGLLVALAPAPALAFGQIPGDSVGCADYGAYAITNEGYTTVVDRTREPWVDSVKVNRKIPRVSWIKITYEDTENNIACWKVRYTVPGTSNRAKFVEFDSDGERLSTTYLRTRRS